MAGQAIHGRLFPVFLIENGFTVRLFQVFASDTLGKPEIAVVGAETRTGLAKTVKVEFLALLPTMYSHCRHCMDLIRASGVDVHSEQFAEYPTETRDNLVKISELARRVVHDFPSGVEPSVIDLASPLGFLKDLRYGVGKGPTVLIDGRKTFDRLPEYSSLRVELLKAGAKHYWSPESSQQL